jgi:F420-dependent oxidoreductase-like protein
MRSSVLMGGNASVLVARHDLLATANFAAKVRIGLSLLYWPWLSLAEQVELAQLADGLGLDSVWVSETWGQEAVATLAHLAARTERIALGAGIMQIPARKPTTAAMAGATLDVLSGGRIRLGFGPSGPQVSEGWYGEPFAAPLRRTRAYVETVRAALAGERVRVPLPAGVEGTGLGKPLRLLAEPVQARIPIYLGATAPRSLRQAGEIADGWIGFLLDPDHPGVLLDPLREGIELAGRAAGEDFDVAAVVPIAIAEDAERARELVRPYLAFYLGAMGAVGKNFYVDLAERYGHGDAARAVQALWLRGEREQAHAAASDAFVDATAIAVAPGGLGPRLARYREAGVTTLIALPAGDRAAVVRALAATA